MVGGRLADGEESAASQPLGKDPKLAGLVPVSTDPPKIAGQGCPQEEVSSRDTQKGHLSGKGDEGEGRGQKWGRHAQTGRHTEVPAVSDIRPVRR